MQNSNCIAKLIKKGTHSYCFAIITASMFLGSFTSIYDNINTSEIITSNIRYLPLSSIPQFKFPLELKKYIARLDFIRTKIRLDNIQVPPPLPLSIESSDLFIKHNLKKSVKSIEDLIQIYVISSHITKSNPKLHKDIASDYAGYILNACYEWDIDPFILTAVITVESNFNKNATNSKSGAVGMMQILWQWHGKNIINAFGCINKKEDIFIPENGINAGSWILYWYLRSYEGSYKKALKKYSGSSNDSYYNKVIGITNNIKNDYKEKFQKVSFHSMNLKFIE